MSDGNMTTERPRPGGVGKAPPTGLATAALCCGLAALALCWAPLVNVISVVAGLVGAGLGVWALVLLRRGLHGGKGRAVTGVAAGGVAVVVSVIVDVVVGLAIAGGSSSAVSGAAGQPAPVPGPKAPATSGSPAPDSTPGATVTESARALRGLAPGESATVGDWTVTLTAVNTDADAVIAQANQYNKAPAGRYVLADVSVVYNGSGEGIAWVALQPEFQGNDARDYSTTTCTAVVPRPSFAQPQLRTGGAADYQVCFDLPAASIPGGRIEVTQFLGVGDPAYWAVPA